ncbi:glycoside hydrolase family 88/105 protein [Croceivirga radicis]|uniref:glycoside hydrolase family 88/105 protein n=1 Tax=Croceivirga radicis TaxID=1929488 RepID=UPI000255B016|nr:glycoside hydrolase family 88 protein [Croceivirga radicis]
MNRLINTLTICFTMVCLLINCKQTNKEAERSSEEQFNAEKENVLAIIDKVNTHWQDMHPKPANAFWHPAAYHTGNIEAYKITKNPAFLEYSKKWAQHNEWKGAKGVDKSKWKYDYGETDDHVLFGDWQIAFQTYADLYTLEGKQHPERIARAKEVMEYQMSTPNNDYWWWADGLYMVMPVMTKLYKITDDPTYLEKLETYLQYADSIMLDKETGLYFRDAKYVFPEHKSLNDKKDFWARGDGWVFAGYAKILQDLPEGSKFREKIVEKFKKMAASLAKAQQPEGYWTRSILDPEHAPGPETSGTAFFTYAYFWGITNGILDKERYTPVAKKAWSYLSKTALQENGAVGYVQPIGERAIPGQVVDKNSTSDFGTGAFLLAASAYFQYLENLQE